ncbi:hypothetical protein QR685DRAFT_421897, partial [Neurospora intermedia]
KCKACLKNKPGEAGWAQIAEWAARGNLTCTDCMRRPQRARSTLYDECYEGNEE